MKLKKDFNFVKAERQLQLMKARISKLNVQTMMWLMNKFARQSIKGLYVEMTGLNEVKRLFNEDSNRLVFMPVLKSSIDYWVLLYILSSQNLELPFTFGSASEQPGTERYLKILQRSGLVFQKREQEYGLQHEYCNVQLIKETLQNNKSIQIFFNSQKLKQNTVTVPSKSEVSVQYLLGTYRQLN